MVINTTTRIAARCLHSQVRSVTYDCMILFKHFVLCITVIMASSFPTQCNLDIYLHCLSDIPLFLVCCVECSHALHNSIRIYSSDFSVDLVLQSWLVLIAVNIPNYIHLLMWLCIHWTLNSYVVLVIFIWVDLQQVEIKACLILCVEKFKNAQELNLAGLLLYYSATTSYWTNISFHIYLMCTALTIFCPLEQWLILLLQYYYVQLWLCM